MVKDLELSLPTAVGVATYPPGASYGPREMRDFEFVWMIEGDAEYTWGDLTVKVAEGAIVLCRPGVRDIFRWDRRKRTRHGYFHFHIQKHPRTWGKIADWPLVREGVEGDVLGPLFKYMLTWAG